MKAHFDTPGAPPVESLHNLAAGMTRTSAAQLFYQICGIYLLYSPLIYLLFKINIQSVLLMTIVIFSCTVLASRDALKVDQKVPYGEIVFSRGLKM